MKKMPLYFAIMTCLSASQCLADDENKTKKQTKKPTYSTTENTTAGSANQPTTTTGRLLASNCFQCHGTNGTGGFERITGGEAREIYDFQGKTPNKNIMTAHTQGYNAAQLNDLITYLNQIR